MHARAAATLVRPLLVLSALFAAAPAAAACSIDVAVENRGTAALEIRPQAWDSGVRLLRIGDEEEVAGGRESFNRWDAATMLGPGETAVHAYEAPPGATCRERRRFQMAYRCVDRDVRGIAFATYPAEDATPGRVTIPLTRCE